ncbi:hypothetical protein NH340_JMT06701 [Sarcoptes scabiei]|nr:hypothetical protein NH340_JMT06701 [Sarcoptes scabiei]
MNQSEDRPKEIDVERLCDEESNKSIDRKCLEVTSEDFTGSFGRWQANFSAFYFVAYILTAFNNLGYVFQSAKTDHQCIDWNDQTLSSSKLSIDLKQLTSESVPFLTSLLPFQTSSPSPLSPSYTIQSDLIESRSIDYESFSKCDPHCTNRIYNNSVAFDQTITSKFELICGDEWLGSFAQSMYQFGYVLSGVIIGMMSDQYGRRIALIVSIVFEIFGGLMLIVSPNIYWYTAARLILGFGDSGRGMCLYMLIIETVGKSRRTDVLITSDFGWIVGYLLLPVIAFVSRNFIIVQLVPTVTMLLMALLWLPHVPESPRWLLTKRRFTKAELVLQKACKSNGKQEYFESNIQYIKIQAKQTPTPSVINVLDEDLSIETKAKKSSKSFWSLFISFRTLMNILILWFTFFVTGFIYHGFSLNIEILGGDVYINFLLAGLIEIPSVLLALIGMRFVGRKTFIIGTIVAATIVYGSIVMLRIWIGSSEDDLILILMTMLGKMFIFSTFNAIYVHAGEIFPTKLRQSGVSSCSIAARIKN